MWTGFPQEGQQGCCLKCCLGVLRRELMVPLPALRWRPTGGSPQAVEEISEPRLEAGQPGKGSTGIDHHQVKGLRRPDGRTP